MRFGNAFPSRARLSKLRPEKRLGDNVAKGNPARFRVIAHSSLGSIWVMLGDCLVEVYMRLVPASIFVWFQ
jgi:hypothetical protein